MSRARMISIAVGVIATITGAYFAYNRASKNSTAATAKPCDSVTTLGSVGKINDLKVTESPVNFKLFSDRIQTSFDYGMFLISQNNDHLAKLAFKKMLSIIPKETKHAKCFEQAAVIFSDRFNSSQEANIFFRVASLLRENKMMDAEQFVQRNKVSENVGFQTHIPSRAFIRE